MAIAALSLLAGATGRAEENRALMRFPTLHGDTIVFVADGNLWAVDHAGGVARRLTSDPGQDLSPHFSPDGKWIAFTADYQGNRDVYVIPAGGGKARRLTYHSDVVDKAPTRWGPANMVVAWTPDSRNVVFLARSLAKVSWNTQPFAVPLTGGLPVPLPLDSGGLMTYGPDGHSIAYTRIFRDFRTWKRYDGGLAQDVFTYDFNTKQLTQITDWKGTDTAPMWAGRKIYFLSDRDDKRRANIWSYDLDTKQAVEVTHFTDYDIDFPSLGDKGIVFQQGGKLWLIDLPGEQLHEIPVTVPDDGTRSGPRVIKAEKFIRDTDTAGQTDFGLSPNGKRAVFSARGDIFTVPAEHGAPRDLTETSNADEDHPAWSPDGKTVAYTTDSSGEQQIATRPAEGGPEKLVTHFDTGFFYTPVWSPDGKSLAFSDNAHRLWLVDAEGGQPKQVAQDAYTEIHDQSWSPDAKWLAYSLVRPNQQRGIWLYEVASGKATPLSAFSNDDSNPVFSPDGKYLWFTSNRHENPTFSQSEMNVATLKTAGIYVATLTKDLPSPFAPRSDEGAVDSKKEGDKPDAEKKPDDDKPAEWKPGASKPIKIDLDGLMDRAVPLPIPPANIQQLDLRGDKIFYKTAPLQMIEGTLPGEKPALHVYDMKERKDETVIEGLESYSIAADGNKFLFEQDKSYTVADTKPGGGDAKDQKKLGLDALQAPIVPGEEWAEMFENAWRLERDLFFNPKMNGVDWKAVHDSYAKLVPLVGSREDLNYVIGQMQGELGNSHTYVGGGDDLDPTESVPVGLLGVDFALDAKSGRYQFAKIYAGDNTRPSYRSPLTEPGIAVKPGDYLLAVNGHDLKAPTNPYSLFVGVESLATLTVSATPEGPGRPITVKPLKNELSVREKDWIDHNRETVDRLSGGKIAYVYLSDMESLGMEQFVRQFYPQLDKHALILDDRWNGGGFIDEIILERLRRVLVGMSTNREAVAVSIPEQLINGPKICLINHYSASDGDIFPFYFRKYGLGPLLGTRTWGGVRGIRGSWGFLDGGYITVPEDSLYGLDSQWVIENHGVDPDIELEDEPADILADHDKQLEAAVAYLMGELAKKPSELPHPPALLPAYPPAGEDAPHAK
jgi:tricorn protease